MMNTTDNQVLASKEDAKRQETSQAPAPKKKLGWGKKILIFLALVIALIYAYANWDGKFNRWHRWTEEVQLSNGETIWVNRSTRYYQWSGSFGNAGGSKNDISSISFDTKKTPLNIPEWNFKVSTPILLDFDAEKKCWFIVTTFDMCRDWKDWGNPIPPYRVYELQGNEWVLVPFDDRLVGRNGNLLFAPPDSSFFIRKEITVQERKKLDWNVGAEYKQIVNYLKGCSNWNSGVRND